MKQRSRKIGKVAALAASEERRFGEQAGRSQRQLNEQLGRLGELNAFRHSYASKSRGLSGINSVQWKDYQNFLQRLDAAINAQQQIVSDCEQALASHRQRWLAKRRRLDSLERILEKYREQEYAHAERLEQKLLDDLPNIGPPGFEADDA